MADPKYTVAASKDADKFSIGGWRRQSLLAPGLTPVQQLRAIATIMADRPEHSQAPHSFQASPLSVRPIL